MSEPVLEIRFALGWLKFYFVLVLLAILLVILLAFLNLDSLHPVPLLIYTVPLFTIVLFSLSYKMKHRDPKVIFSEEGIEMTSGLKRFSFQDGISFIKAADKIFVPWSIIHDAEFITGRGATAIALDTDEDETWRATRAVLPVFAGTTFRKYIFDVSNLEVEPTRIVTIIKRLAETPTAERKDVLLHFSKNLV